MQNMVTFVIVNGGKSRAYVYVRLFLKMLFSFINDKIEYQRTPLYTNTNENQTKFRKLKMATNKQQNWEVLCVCRDSSLNKASECLRHVMDNCTGFTDEEQNLQRLFSHQNIQKTAVFFCNNFQSMYLYGTLKGKTLWFKRCIHFIFQKNRSEEEGMMVRKVNGG